MPIEPITSFTGDHRWLSNFWLVDVVFENQLYPSVEHAYVAAKTLDHALREEIKRAPTPGSAKRLGRKIKLRPDWEMVKLTIMEDLIRQKFQHVQMRRLLMSTGEAELIEGNTWGDRFWGVCDGEGENHLGQLIMKVRAEWPADGSAS